MALPAHLGWFNVLLRPGGSIFRTAAELLANYQLKQKVRLIGVGTSGLTDESPPVQLDLFNHRTESNVNWEKVDQAVDSIHSKFGKGAIRRARFSEEEKKKD